MLRMLLTWLGAALAHVLFAQFVFDRMGEAEGLPGAQVLALHEDRDGFIWIGTDNGLVRHEGVRLRTWFHDRKDPGSLPNSIIWDITSDDFGRVWIATDHGLAVMDDLRGVFRRLYVRNARHDATSANRVHRIVSDGRGRMWLLTEEGVHVFDQSRLEAVDPPVRPEVLDMLTEQTNHFEIELDTVRRGLWLVARDRPMFVNLDDGTAITAGSATGTFSFIAEKGVQGITPDGRGGVWFGSREQTAIVHVDAQGRRRRWTLNEPGAAATPQFIRTDALGRVWLSTWTHHLFVLDPHEAEPGLIRPAEELPWSISNGNAKSWLQDRNGLIWIGTMDGLNVMHPRDQRMRIWKISGQGEPLGLNAVAALDSDRCLLATDGHGYFLLDRSNSQQQSIRLEQHPRGPEHLEWANYAQHLAPFGDGWLAASMNGLVSLNVRSLKARMSADELDEAGKLTQGAVTFITDVGNGEHWIGTWRSGLFSIKPGERPVRIDSLAGAALPSRWPLSCAHRGRDTWIGYNNGAGLVQVRDGRIITRLLYEPDSNGTNYGVITSLAIADDGSLYIGTVMGGLGVRNASTGAITWYTRADGLSEDRVERLLIDGRQRVWIRTVRSICRFDPERGAIEDLSLPAALRAMGHPGEMALDADGSILIPWGPFLIDLPMEDEAMSKAPAPRLLRLDLGDTKLAEWPADSVITLSPEQRSARMFFGSPSYFNAWPLRMEYSIPGLVDEWHELGADAMLDMDGLPTGRHELLVRTSSDGRIWGVDPLRVQLEMLPPFWETWWFRTLAASTIIALLFFGFRLVVRARLRRERERHARMEAVLQERMRIASDMHDDLGAGLSALKLRSEMALRGELDPDRKDHLVTLAGTAGELLASMRQIIWAMNSDQASLEDLVVYTTSYARGYGQAHGLTVVVHTDQAWPDMNLGSQERRNVFLVMKEALHNVVKHAGAGAVTVRMEWKDMLMVEIIDDGIGLPVNAQAGVGNGLRNMRKRIEALGGEFSVEAAPVKGTRVRFIVPVTNQGSIASDVQSHHLRPE